MAGYSWSCNRQNSNNKDSVIIAEISAGSTDPANSNAE